MRTTPRFYSPSFVFELPIFSLNTFRSLRSLHFRRYFIGQAVSLTGSWMQSVAITWLVYRLSGSAGVTGTVGFLASFPALVVTPLAGTLADRFSRRKLLLGVHYAMLLLTSALTVATLAGQASITLLGCFAFVQGMLNAIEIPARHAFLAQVIDDKNDLPNAIALNSATINATRLIGPSLGGLIIVAFGEGACFGLNAVSYLAVIVQLHRIVVVEPLTRRLHQHFLADFMEGWRFAWGNPVIRPVVLLAAAVSVTTNPYSILMPALSVEHFGRGAELNGLFISCVGAGALVSALALAARSHAQGLTRWALFSAICASIGAVGLALSSWIVLSMFCLVLIGGGLIGTAASVNTLVQTVVGESFRGRVVSVYSTFFIGAIPVGHLAAGWLATHFGAPATFLVLGLLCGAGAIRFGLHLARVGTRKSDTSHSA